jgi:hypothetical protein
MDDSPAAILLQSSEQIWDLEDSTTDSDLSGSPLGQFVTAFNARSRSERSLQRLALFAARRAEACWRVYCDGTTPFDGIQAAEKYLAGSAPRSAVSQFSEPAVPSFRGLPIVDCRQCDTSCAAAAVAHMARFIASNDLRDLAICLSSADMAFDQSPLVSRDRFRRWLIEIAIPVALEGRELTEEEATRFRDYSLAQLDIHRETGNDA